MKKALFSLLMALMLIPCVSMAQKPAKAGTVVFFDTTVCDSLVWDRNGSVFTSSGVNRVVIGDTTYVINFTVNNSYVLDDTVEASCDYSWQGTTYVSDTVVTKTLTTMHGCDSTVTLRLTLTKTNIDYFEVTTCHPYVFRGEEYSVADIYVDSARNEELLCDSVFLLSLTIEDTMMVYLPYVEVCSRYTWDINDSVYTASTITAAVLPRTDESQCDTMYALALVVGEPASDTTTVTACRSYQWSLTDSLYTESTVDVFAYKAETDAQCDTNFVLALTILDTLHVATEDSVCGYYTCSVNDSLYTSNALDTLFSADTTLASCDTLYTLDLKIGKKVDTVVANVCGSYIYTRHFANDSTAKDTVYETGHYFDTIVASNGCETDYVYDLTITPIRYTVDTIDTVRCRQLSLFLLRTNRDSLIVFDAAHPNGQVRSAVERVTIERNSVVRAHYSLNRAPSCMDSLLIFNITINKTTSDVEQVGSCGEYTWDAARRKVVDTTHWGGLDSVSIINRHAVDLYELTVGEETYKVIVSEDSAMADADVETLGGDRLVILPSTYSVVASTTPEVSTDTVKSVLGNATLTFDEENEFLFTVNADDTIDNDKAIYVLNYMDTVLNRVGGIDTTVVVFDSVHRIFKKNGRDSVVVGLNDYGCDLYKVVNVTIHNKPIVSISGDFKVKDNNDVAKIYAVFDSADSKTKYEWTLNGSGTISDNKKDTVTITGLTANSDVMLKVTDKNMCTAESWITILFGVGINEADNLNLSLYPNPTAQVINLTAEYEMNQIVIYNMVGVQGMNKQVNGTAQSLDLSALPQGAYTLRVNMADGKSATRRFIKSK